jgi:hypothetical protein
MTARPRKRRTREHVIADLGVNHLERHILLCGHTPRRAHMIARRKQQVHQQQHREGLGIRVGWVEPRLIEARPTVTAEALGGPPAATRRSTHPTMVSSSPFEGHGAMSKPPISFTDLRRVFKDLAFAEVVVPKSHVAFLHADSRTEIFLPLYRSNQRVAPRHLAAVRAMLDAKGLLDGEEFDHLVADVAARHSVSG